MGKGRGHALTEARYCIPTTKNLPEEQPPEMEALFYEIYDKYVKEHPTILDLAREYKIAPTFLAKALKWCAMRSPEGEDRVFRQVLDDKLQLQLASLKNTLERAQVKGKIKEEVMVFAEIRRTLKMLGVVRGVEGTKKDQTPSVTVIMPSVDRGTGSATVVHEADGKREAIELGKQS